MLCPVADVAQNNAATNQRNINDNKQNTKKPRTKLKWNWSEEKNRWPLIHNINSLCVICMF